MSRLALKASRFLSRGQFHRGVGVRFFTQAKRDFPRISAFHTPCYYRQYIPSKFAFDDFLANIDEYIQKTSANLVEDLSSVTGRLALTAKAQTLFQPLLMTLHASTGLPYWGAIGALSIALRTLLIPFYVVSMKEEMKKKSHKTEIDILETRIKMADSKEKNVIRMELADFYKKHGIKEWKRFGTLLQIPLLVPMFFTLRSMTKSVAAFQTSKFLWCSSLAAPDPFFILPVVNALIMLLNMKMTQKVTGQSLPAWLQYGACAMSAIFTLKFSSCFFMFWIPLQVMTLLQNLAMNWWFNREQSVQAIDENLDEEGEVEGQISFVDTAEGEFYQKEQRKD